MSKTTSSTTAEPPVTIVYELHGGHPHVCLSIIDMDTLQYNVNFWHKRPSECWFILVPKGMYKGETNEST